VAKNALTVGNVEDAAFQRVGELWNGVNASSRGPTGDRRMKPNLTATGATVTSARAGTTNGYADRIGCSMATPHVTGVAASLLEHYPDFRGRPHLLRAHLMASSVLHRDTLTPPDNDGGGRDDYGLGRVSDYQSHWAHPNRSGWTGHWAWMTITDRRWGHFDVEVPPGARRLVAVLTWDEPEASAGASQAVIHDIDLWADLNADCAPDAQGQCGEWASQSFDDNTEYLIIDNPPPGRYRLKAINWRAPSSGLPVAIAAKVVRGDPTPTAALSARPSTPSPPVGSTFTVTTTVSNPAYEAYGVHVSVPFVPVGLTLLDATTTREDGVSMVFPNASGLTLGSVVEGDTRSAFLEIPRRRAGAAHDALPLVVGQRRHRVPERDRDALRRSGSSARAGTRSARPARRSGPRSERARRKAAPPRRPPAPLCGPRQVERPGRLHYPPARLGFVGQTSALHRTPPGAPGRP
jgi:hypothetical protein